MRDFFSALNRLNGFLSGFSSSIFLGLPAGISMAIIKLLTGASDDNPIINTVEVFNFKLQSISFKNILIGIIVGGFISLGTSLAFSIGFSSFNLGIEVGIALGIVTAVIFTFTMILSDNIYTLKDAFIREPNEGIYRTGKYAAIGLCSGIVILLMFCFCKNLQFFKESKEIEKLEMMMYLFATMYMWMVSLEMGLKSWWRHYLLRYMLYKENMMPSRYVPFLEYCCRLGYLKRVGGGYTFYHQELKDYLLKDYRSKFSSVYRSKFLDD